VLKTLRQRDLAHAVNEADGTDRQLPHILSLHIPGHDAADMVTALAERISMATGAACRSAAGKTSTVLAAMGQDALRASQTLRLSFGDGVTPADAERAAGYIADYAVASAV
jgi:cysteine desulfurase